MAKDNSYITVPSIEYANVVENLNKPLTEAQQNEIAIRKIAQSLTDDFTIYSEQGLDGIGYTLRPYNSESYYNVNGQQVKYYLVVTITPRRPEITLYLTPTSEQFNLYSTPFLRLYNNPPVVVDSTLTPITQSNTSSNNETVTVGGSRRQDYQYKKRI
jgi:hypothetical protein